MYQESKLPFFIGADTDSVFGESQLVGPVVKKNKALSAYSAAQEQGVADTKSAEMLVIMLFDKACALLARAVQSSEAQDLETFHQSTLHALQIVLSLRFVLNAGSGSKLFASLFATYTTIAASLKKAKEEQDIKSIETIYEALDELRSAWHSVA